MVNKSTQLLLYSIIGRYSLIEKQRPSKPSIRVRVPVASYLCGVLNTPHNSSMESYSNTYIYIENRFQ